MTSEDDMCASLASLRTCAKAALEGAGMGWAAGLLPTEVGAGGEEESCKGGSCVRGLGVNRAADGCCGGGCH